MAIFKVTYIFGGAKQGWTESFYMDSSTSRLAVESASAKSYILARNNCLGTPNYVEAVRASAIDNPGDTSLLLLTATPSGDSPADYVNIAVRVKLVTAEGRRRDLWLRGCPDAWVGWQSEKGSYLKVEGAGGPITRLVNQMVIDPAFKIRGWKRDGAMYRVGLPGGMITADPQTALTKIAVAGLDPLAVKVQMKKWKGPDAKLFNRTWNIAAIDDTWVVITLPYNELGNPAQLTSGRVLPKVYVYDNVSNVGGMDVRAHKTGRAFFVPAGRRRKPA